MQCFANLIYTVFLYFRNLNKSEVLIKINLVFETEILSEKQRDSNSVETYGVFCKMVG